MSLNLKLLQLQFLKLKQLPITIKLISTKLNPQISSNNQMHLFLLDNSSFLNSHSSHKFQILLKEIIHMLTNLVDLTLTHNQIFPNNLILIKLLFLINNLTLDIRINRLINPYNNLSKSISILILNLIKDFLGLEI